MTALRVRSALTLAALAATAACGGNRSGPDAGDEARQGMVGAEATDSARGIVAVVGADPATMVVVRTADGPVTIRGPVADTLRAINGVEVQVSGTERGDGSLEASSFRVRSADGLPAVDGILEIQGDTAVLTGPEGERARHAPVPASLRALEGRRVWIAGRSGGAPESWGSIDRSR